MRTASLNLPLIFKIQGGLAVWMAVVYGALKVGDIPGDWNLHMLCGAWGCLPQPQALVGYHLFWFAVLAPAAGLTVWFSGRAGAMIAGYTCGGLGLLLMAGMLGWLTWYQLPELISDEPTYFWQRYLFTLATTIDIPVIQLTVCGAGMLAAAWLKPAEPRTNAVAKPATAPQPDRG